MAGLPAHGLGRYFRARDVLSLKVGPSEKEMSSSYKNMDNKRVDTCVIETFGQSPDGVFALRSSRLYPYV